MSPQSLQRGAYALVVLLGLAVLLCAGIELFTLTAPILKNYNEGWNATHAQAAMPAPASLYPGAQSFVTNNYPPLSFFVVGWTASLTGLDAILAGRLVSFLALVGTGICLSLAARAFGCRWRYAIMAALLFWAAPWVIVRFAAMNDPQLLGNVLGAIGLAVIARNPRSMRHIALCALFLTLAEFVKPIYVTLPLALLAWLFVTQRRSAWALAGFGLLFAVMGYALTYFILHVELLGQLFSPRVFLWSKITGQPGQWLLVEALPLLASLALLRRRGDAPALFAGLYAALAFVLALFFSGGDGVSASQMMEPAMAVALGAALWLHKNENRRCTFPALGFVAALQAVMLVLSFLGLWAARPSLQELMGSRYATRFDVALIARHKEPVLCETMALCYWAGKTPQMDAFGFTQALKSGKRSPDDFVRLLDAKAYSMIQLQPRSQFALPSPLWNAIIRSYYLEHQDKNGFFLIPRD